MSIRSQLKRAPSVLCLLLIAVGPVNLSIGEDSSPPKTKPISQNNRSSQSSRYGDRVQQMKSRSSSPSRSPTVSRSSSSRTPSASSSSRSSSSYSPSSRSSSSSATSRSRTSSPSSYSRSQPSSSSSYSRSSSSNRGSTYTRSTTSSSSSSYRRNTSPTTSSSVDRSRSPSPSSPSVRSRTSNSSSSYTRSSRSTAPTSVTRGSSNRNSSVYDRSRGSSSSNPYVQSNDRRSSSSMNSRTRTGSAASSSAYTRVPNNSSSMNRDDRRDSSSYNRSNVSRGTSSVNQRRDQQVSGRNYSRSGSSNTSYDRSRSSSSHERYTHSRNSNHDRNKHIHSGYPKRYVFDSHRFKGSRHYNYDRFRYGAYCPFYDRLYYDSYYKRRYYSPTVFSTIILSAGVTNTVYDSYDYGNYTTYKSSEPFVELFEHSRFRGESLQVFAGEAIYDLKEIRFDSYKSFNDRFSSIKVYGDVTVILYVDRDFGGDYIYLHGSHIDFTRDAYLRRFNDRISSIEVVPGIINEADHRAGSRDYLLNSQLLEASPYQEPVSTPAYVAPTAAPVRNAVPMEPSATSVIQTRQARVILYDQPNYKGNQIILTPGDVHVDLVSLSKGLAGTWNDCVASIRIEGSTELFVYCDKDFSGDGIAIRHSVPNMSLDTTMVPFVNRVSSVVVNAVY